MRKCAFVQIRDVSLRSDRDQCYIVFVRTAAACTKSLLQARAWLMCHLLKLQRGEDVPRFACIYAGIPPASPSMRWPCVAVYNTGGFPHASDGFPSAQQEFLQRADNLLTLRELRGSWTKESATALHEQLKQLEGAVDYYERRSQLHWSFAPVPASAATCLNGLGTVPTHTQQLTSSVVLPSTHRFPLRSDPVASKPHHGITRALLKDLVAALKAEGAVVHAGRYKLVEELSDWFFNI
jgi:hypothetical protein